MFRTTVASLRRYFYKSAPVRGVYELSIDTMKPSKVAAYVDSIGPLLSSSLSSKSRLLGSFTTYLGSQTGEFVYLREHGRFVWKPWPRRMLHTKIAYFLWYFNTTLNFGIKQFVV